MAGITGPSMAPIAALRVLAEQILTIGNSPVELKGGSTREATRTMITVDHQTGAGPDMRIGQSGVTTTTGSTHRAGEFLPYPIGDQAIYGIAASNISVHVREWGP